MTRCTRRQFLVSAAAAAALGGPRAPGVASAQTNVKLGTAVLGDYALAGPFIVALDKGYFRAEGLNAEIAALSRKEIHAFVWGDGGAVTQLQGKSKVLGRLDQVTPMWISQIQYVSEDGIKKNNDAIRKATRAIFLGQRFMRTNTNEAAEIISKQIGWPPEAVLGAHKISGTLLSESGQFSMEALKAVQDTLIEYGVIKKRLPLEELVTREFVPVKI